MKRKPATALIFRAKIIHFPSLQIREFEQPNYLQRQIDRMTYHSQPIFTSVNGGYRRGSLRSQPIVMIENEIIGPGEWLTPLKMIAGVPRNRRTLCMRWC
jgi:hypothetical protein